ncbi:MAG: cysteine desulfurase family protein [Faecalibacterium sp.]
MLQNPELHYLDNAATTMVAPEVADVIDKAMREHWANPSSLYSPGARSEEALNAARAAVARTLGCKPKELYTLPPAAARATIWPCWARCAPALSARVIVVSGFEHPSVQRPLEELAKQGYNVTVVKPRPDGTLDMDRMLEHVDKNTILVACMMVNNEVGTRNDVERLAAEVKRRNSRTIVHVDAVQAWMRVPIKLTNIDTLSVSGHKIHAPKGIGALYLSDRLVQAFRPPYLGGEQERGLRPGTENLPYAMGLAAAATRLAKTMKSRDTAMKALNQRLRDGLKAFPEVEINSPENAVPEVLNFSEMCIKSETMLAWLAEAQVYVSSASACGRGQPSHTLAAMGKDPLAIDTAIRVSFCGDNTPEDVDAFLNRFEDGMKSLQRIRK